MLKQLRNKFILTNTLYVGIVLIIVFVLICLFSYDARIDELNELLTKAVSRPFPDENRIIPFDDDVSFEASELIPYILIIKENESQKTKVLKFGAEMEENALGKAMDEILRREDTLGEIGGNFVYAISRTENETVIALSNTSYIRASVSELIKLLTLIGACALALVILVSFPVSKVALLNTEKAWEQQKRFIADASHALKTPLTVILANIAILKGTPLGQDGKTARWLVNTEEEANGMHALIRDMLVLEQSDLNVRRTDFANVNLSQLLNGLALQFEAIAFDRNIAFETSIQENVEIRGNEKALSQMVSALLENALKYEKDNGFVRLKLEKQVRKTILSVYNASTFIPEDEREHIFGRFSRLKSSETRAHEGHGLGLSIARSVADVHQAAIEIESGKALGTEFRVTFRHIL